MATAPTTGDTAEAKSESTALTTGDTAEAKSESTALTTRRVSSADETGADQAGADDTADAGGDDRSGRRGWRRWLPGRKGSHVRAPRPWMWLRGSLGRKAGSARVRRPRRRIGLIDVLRLLGLARRAVPHPVVGPKAYPQWWQRLLALGVLGAMVVGIGFVLAAMVGIMVVVAGFLLEQAIS